MTGEIDVHDVAVEDDGQVLFANTLFSCLARLSERHSFEPVWRPLFVSTLAPEDRCHFNGLAMEGPRPLNARQRPQGRQVRSVRGLVSR